MTPETQNSLPLVIAGPMVRHVTQHTVTLWLATTRRAAFHISLVEAASGKCFVNTCLSSQQASTVQVGHQAFITLLEVPVDTPLPLSVRINYDLRLETDGITTPVTSLVSGLTYEGETTPNFTVCERVRNLLHGSCRKPHHSSGDGLLQVDRLLKETRENPEEQPDMLIMSGDQVYTDDVAGPMLVAIHRVIETLGLFHERLEGAVVDDTHGLIHHPHSYYQRPKLLPNLEANKGMYTNFFAAKRKPIFTSVNANNHLMAFAEVMAMYLLTWSPELWALIDIDDSDIQEQFKPLFAEQKTIIEAFASGLSDVRRALAHLPVYMIFDDHDVTDDWNLTRGWEEAVYQHPFARRIIGNAMIGYWLCQGWGNAPDKFAPLVKDISRYFSTTGLLRQDELIERLQDWQQWHYELNTLPKIVVLDTRTQRWRSESDPDKPSGLMDWEALCELQQSLMNQPAVIMVSAAPVFGVKLIEAIQKVFTMCGQALTVDAENWMAHKGTASVILNIFRHVKTPPNFVILSGDVHYSFVYDVSLKFRRNSPQITQITSSGIKNEFPGKLLRWLDKLNRVFYGRRSPLNWFTQRRNMSIRHRRPEGQAVRTLLNYSGIGQLKVDRNCHHVEARQITHTGKSIRFGKAQDE